MREHVEEHGGKPSDAAPRSHLPPASRLARTENASRRKPFPAALTDAPSTVLLFLSYRPLSLEMALTRERSQDNARSQTWPAPLPPEGWPLSQGCAAGPRATLRVSTGS